MANEQTIDAVKAKSKKAVIGERAFGGALVWNVHEYRPDIDGLRALAVLSIMFLHLGWPTFPGAFYLLDMFLSFRAIS